MVNDLARRVDDELERLSRDLVLKIPVAMGTALDARSHQILIERQKRALERIRLLFRIRVALHRWGAYALPEGAIGIGSEVVLRCVRTGAKLRRVLIGASLDLAPDEVALDSPLGAALIGRHVGDTVNLIETGGGNEKYRVVAVTTLSDLLGETQRSGTPSRTR